MSKVRYTKVQKRVLKALVHGAKIRAYTYRYEKQCFKSNYDGLKSVLYLTITMRALCDKGAVLCIDDNDCMITEKGLDAISCPLPVEY